MNIYVDFDDCLCETGKAFAGLAADLFGSRVPYEGMRHFNLQKAFSLTDEQYDRLLAKGHEPEVRLSFGETPGAPAVLRDWLARGIGVSVITGRPFGSYEPSRAWLDRHGLRDVPLYCLDKYGRENFLRDSGFSLKLDDYYKMKFDFAVEDSPLAFRFFDHLPNLRVMVFDRPWNREAAFPNDRYRRCLNWESIRKAVAESISPEGSI